MSNGGKGKPRKKTAKKGKASTRARTTRAKTAKARKPAAAPPPPEDARTVSPQPSPSPDFKPEQPAMSPEAAGGEPAAESGGSAGAWVAAAVVLAVIGGGYVTWPMWSHLVATGGPGEGVETIIPPAETEQAAPPVAIPAAPPAAIPAAPPAASAEALTGDPKPLETMGSKRAQLVDELKGLMARIESVEKSVDTVKKMIRATAPPGEKMASEPSVQQLADRLDQLEKEGGTLKALLQRVDQLERSGVQAGAPGPAGVPDDSRARAVVLAVANLREAVNRDEPFDKALEALKAVGGDDPDVRVAVVLLQKTAPTGIPTLATLRDRFQAIAGKIVQASKALEERGWWEQVANRVSSLVTWRRVGGDSQDASVDALVARAEERLKAGELKAAVDAVEGLSATPKAAAVAAPWLEAAKARVTAERAVATLHVHAVSLLAPAKE